MKPLVIARWVSAAAIAVCGAVFLARFAPARVVLLRHGSAALAAMAIALAAIAAGEAILRLLTRALRQVLPPEDTDPLEGAPERPQDPSSTASLLIGSAVLGQLIAIPVWLHLSIRWTVPLVVLLLAARGALLIWRRRAWRSGASSIDTLALLLLTAPILLGLIQALAPTTSPDELVYKLAVPANYILHGGAVDLPLNSDSYLCMALQHVDLAAMLLSGASAARLFHFLLYLATLIVLFRFADGIGGRAAARTVTAVFAFTPALALTAGWAWLDWPMLGLLLLSASAWLQMRARADAAAASLVIGSLAAAAATKYTALPWIAVAFPIMAWRMRKRLPLGRFIAAALALAILTGGLFYLRNFLWTGSPFAPFLMAGAPQIENFRSDSGWLELARGMDIFHPAIADDSLAIALPACVLISFVGIALYPALADLFLIGILQVIALTFLAPTSRLSMTGFAPLAFIGALTIAHVVQSSSVWWRRAFLSAAVVAFAAQSVLIGWIYFGTHPVLPTVFGAESERDLIRRTRPYAEAYEWIDRSLPRDATILLIGENRAFHLGRRNLAAGNLDGPRIAALLASEPSPERLHRRLRAMGVTHLVIHPEWLRVADPPLPLSLMEREYIVQVHPVAAGVFQAMLERYTTRVWRDRTYRIHELAR